MNFVLLLSKGNINKYNNKINLTMKMRNNAKAKARGSQSWSRS